MISLTFGLLLVLLRFWSKLPARLCGSSADIRFGELLWSLLMFSAKVSLRVRFISALVVPCK